MDKNRWSIIQVVSNMFNPSNGLRDIEDTEEDPEYLKLDATIMSNKDAAFYHALNEGTLADDILEDYNEFVSRGISTKYNDYPGLGTHEEADRRTSLIVEDLMEKLVCKNR